MRSNQGPTRPGRQLIDLGTHNLDLSFQTQISKEIHWTRGRSPLVLKPSVHSFGTARDLVEWAPKGAAVGVNAKTDLSGYSTFSSRLSTLRLAELSFGIGAGR